MYNFNFTGLFIVIAVIGAIAGIVLCKVLGWLFTHLSITIGWL